MNGYGNLNKSLKVWASVDFSRKSLGLNTDNKKTVSCAYFMICLSIFCTISCLIWTHHFPPVGLVLIFYE